MKKTHNRKTNTFRSKPEIETTDYYLCFSCYINRNSFVVKLELISDSECKFYELLTATCFVTIRVSSDGFVNNFNRFLIDVLVELWFFHGGPNNSVKWLL